MEGLVGPKSALPHAVFVLTHFAQPSLQMEGGTVFHFVTGGIDSALEQARKAAAGRDIRVGGGVATIRAYLEAGHIDEMHIAISSVLLGGGEHLFFGLNLPALGYELKECIRTEAATHLIVGRRS